MFLGSEGEDFFGGKLVAGDFLVEFSVVVGFLAGLVVRADFLANVAAVKEFLLFDDFGEGGWNGVFVFDSEVGNAKARVYDAGGDDRAGGAGVEAFGAVGAGFEMAVWLRLPAGLGLVGLGKVEGGDDFAEEKPRAVGGADEAGVFAYSSKAGLFGEGAFENRAGVDIGFVLMFGGDLFEVGDELFQFFGDDFVIVAAEGVAGDAAVGFLERFLVVVIIGGEADDGFGFGEDLGEVAALLDFFHVLHLALMAGGEPVVEGLEVFLFDFGGGEADEVEAE